MRILFVVPYVPNLIRVRPYNLIRYLAARGHRVTVLTLWMNEEERATLAQLTEICHDVRAVHLTRWRSLWNCLQALPTRTPLQAVYCWHPALVQQPGLLAPPHNGGLPFDVVHVEHLRGAHYGLQLKGLKANPDLHPATVPVLWDSVDSISFLFRQAAARSKSHFGRWLTRFELGRTERYEGWLVNQFDRVLVTSPADRQALLSLASLEHKQPAIAILPNGVDLDYFQPDGAVNREPATLVISGKMSYHANVTMVLYLVREIMPRVWARRPDARLTIVGKDPPRQVLTLAQNPAITVTGSVADIRPYLQQATLAVSPITYGAGIQNKVLEAMACATPVVASPLAVAALNVLSDRDVLIAGEPDTFAEAVLRLLAATPEQQRLGLAGRHYVETHHNWAQIAAQLEDVYWSIIRDR